MELLEPRRLAVDRPDADREDHATEEANRKPAGSALAEEGDGP